MAAEYNILTWNIRGLANPIKRHRVGSYLRRRRIHIACLQETHMIEAELIKVGRRWCGQVYGTSYSAFTKGVLIWIAPGVPFVKTRVTIDRGGAVCLPRG